MSARGNGNKRMNGNGNRKARGKNKNGKMLILWNDSFFLRNFLCLKIKCAISLKKRIFEFQLLTYLLHKPK